ncbi:FUSC family protein [Bradyrhizobium sp. Tv2a-2]|uniref:FUSC family protein n=1 Tax=Bradyrhizobium sp. Tv2a-2 TaxID=113395 RepID=UPI0003F5DC45|nr:FUSC family protein [Bradyrhizobium sp. Tv2a-2]
MPDHAKRLETTWRHLRALTHRYRLQLILAVRVTVSALLAFVLAQALHLRLPLWAVLTSLIVTQMSLGRSLKVASDYLTGTFLGVAYGGALAILIPHESEWALLGVLALAIAPLALIASFRTNFNVLPVTAVIVLLVPAMQHVSPTASALDRVLEVVVGGVTGFVVSVLVFPARGHELTTDAAASMLGLIANALSDLLREVARPPDSHRVRRINDSIGAALTRLTAIGQEAEHERTARLTSAPDTGPLLRTLLRLRHDIVMLGRAIGCDLPAHVAERLAPSMQDIARATTDFLRASGEALRELEPPPPIDDVGEAFGAYAVAFEALRREGLTREMPSDVVERFFALGFALDQVREHLTDLHRVVGEWARK